MIDTLLWRAKDQRVHVSIPYVSNSCFIFHAQTFFNKKKTTLKIQNYQIKERSEC